MPEFKTRDSTGPAFWDERFQQAFMPWDRAGIPTALSEFVRNAPTPMATLIPGCGVGYEVALLAESGWDVTAIDFSPAAVKAARENLGEFGKLVIEADFFTFLPPRTLDLIYERAFLCALPPAMREAIAARWAALLPAGALLVGYFFIDTVINGKRGGPPFSIEAEQLKTLLEPNFECIEDQPVDDSIAVFVGKERWQIWRRRP